MRTLRRVCMLVCLSGGILYAQKIETQRPVSGQENTTSLARPRVPADKVLADTAHLEWVKHLASNSASSVDFATDVAVDASGFVYVTGKSESSEDGRDYLTIKYTSLGQEVWRARYDGPAHADDVPTALVVEESGNVYVTGMSKERHPYSVGDTVSYDYTTIKYSPSGQEVWVSRYNGADNLTDAAVAIALDVAGNVYVTGESNHLEPTQYGWRPNTDFATIKYDPDGAQQWVAHYNSADNLQDIPIGLTVDNFGNVFVTGGSGEQTDYGDFVVVKYNSIGNRRWVTQLTVDSFGGKIVGVAADNSGSVYISGSVFNWHGIEGGRSYFFSAKYDSMGQRQWLRPYDTSSAVSYLASSMAVDSAGNLVVAAVGGSSMNWFFARGDHMLVMKYTANGDLLWSRDRLVARFKLSEMVLDRADNIYITGSSGDGSSTFPLMGDSIVVVKYDGGGAPQWVEYYHGVAGSENEALGIAVDGVGGIVVAGASGTLAKSDFVTIKYQPSGIKQWDVQATGEGSSFESVSDMALDAAGNVYVTGSSLDMNSSCDYFTAKFNPQGDQLWKTKYNGPANSDDRSNAIVLDGLGDVYVTGSSQGIGTSKDWATIKYSSSGIQQWVARYNGQSNQNDDGQLIVVDTALNVYVAGVSASGLRLTTIKYSPSGVQQWSASHDSANFVAMPGGLSVDKNGNVYVTNPLWYWDDAIAFKYNSLGNEVWRVFGGNDLLVDDSANVYVSGANMSGWTNKYNSAGALIWHVGRGGTRIEFDNLGDILFHNTWSIPSSSGKITKNGAIQWGRGDSPAEYAFGFCVDGVGNSYVSGHMYASEAFPGNYSAKMSPTGSLEWLAEYHPENSVLVTQACKVDAAGNLYVAGTSQRGDFSNAATILKYAQITVSVGEGESTLPGSYSLSQNYPNPFNPSTTIRFALPKNGHVELKVYNTLGQEVATLVNEEKTAGTYSAQWNAGSVASGVYFYRLRSGEYTETRKLLLLR